MSLIGVRAVGIVSFRQIHALSMYLCVLPMAVLPWQHVGCMGPKCMLRHMRETVKGVARIDGRECEQAVQALTCD